MDIKKLNETMQELLSEEVVRTGVSREGTPWKEELVDEFSINILGVEIPYQVVDFKMDKEEDNLRSHRSVAGGAKFSEKVQELQKEIEAIIMAKMEEKGHDVERFGSWMQIGIPQDMRLEK